MKERPYVMVVDDDQEMVRMLNRTFELEGYSVAIATDGSSALTLLEAHRLDLVILDIMMPELDGFQVLELIRQRCSAPVIVLTARSEVNPLRRALVAGAGDYVSMPFQTRELVDRVKAKLRRTVPRNPGRSLAGTVGRRQPTSFIS